MAERLGQDGLHKGVARWPVSLPRCGEMTPWCGGFRFPARPAPLHRRRAPGAPQVEKEGHPFLVFRDDQGRQRLEQLEGRAGRVTIGRNPTNDVALTWDEEV